jgi:hypothetical protein
MRIDVLPPKLVPGFEASTYVSALAMKTLAARAGAGAWRMRPEATTIAAMEELARRESTAPVLREAGQNRS